MIFEPLYPNATSLEPIIENLISVLSDVDYQRGAHYWAANQVLETAPAEEQPDEPVILEPFALVDEAVVWREQEGKVPALLIFDARTDPISDDDQEAELEVSHTISLYLALANQDRVALRREAFWRTLAVDMMIRSCPKDVLLAGTNITRPIVEVLRRRYDGTAGGGSSYTRVPSVDVRIKGMEGL